MPSEKNILQPRSYRCSVPIQIRMNDLDPFVHVNNGVQCNYFDYGRSCYFEQVFRTPINWSELDLVLVHIELDFKQGIEYHDDIVCETQVLSVGNKSLKMMQQLRDVKTNMIKSTCFSVVAGFDRHTHLSIPIREEYKRLFYEFEDLSYDQ